jgi:hypothetical protein
LAGTAGLIPPRPPKTAARARRSNLQPSPLVILITTGRAPFAFSFPSTPSFSLGFLSPSDDFSTASLDPSISCASEPQIEDIEAWIVLGGLLFIESSSILHSFFAIHGLESASLSRTEVRFRSFNPHRF